MNNKLEVNSEIKRLTNVLIHSPDGGIGKVPANKLREWLYDDIVDVKKIQEEYKSFFGLLLLFLSPEYLFSQNGQLLFSEKDEIQLETNPGHPDYFAKSIKSTEAINVLDTQYLLGIVLRDNPIPARDLIISICAIEAIHANRKADIIELLNAAHEEKDSDKQNALFSDLVKVLLTGKLVAKTSKAIRYVFPPIPNFIFTRDIGITIGDHLLVTKPKFYIRKREVMLMSFLAEYYFCKNGKIIRLSEDDNFFQIDEENQLEKTVNYEGGDIMMISPNHLLVGASERTSPYAIQKLIHRLFWEEISKKSTTEAEKGIEMVSVIKIGEKRSQMHIDTVLTHLREDLWALHGPLSEVLTGKQENENRATRNYNDALYQKSKKQLEKEKDVTIFQFYLNQTGREIKSEYCALDEVDANRKNELKRKFKKLDFLLKEGIDEAGEICYFETKTAYSTSENQKQIKEEQVLSSCKYQPPKGLENLLRQISHLEFGQNQNAVKFVYSGGGIAPFDTREQWTDACNLLTLKSGVCVGYNRNHKTALHFNKVLKDEPVTEFREFKKFIQEKNAVHFKDEIEEGAKINHLVYAKDLFAYIRFEEKLNLEETNELLDCMKNMLILLPSSELSRARGGSHCMSMPLSRD
ncbi:MAG: arginine deiminase [Crocinitomix sp.]|jgi:arginine deiminase